MLEHIEFNSNKFEKDSNMLGGELTENTIVLCSSYETMDMLHKSIVCCLNENDEQIDLDIYSYYCEDEDINNAKTTLAFSIQRVIKINNQTITLSLEPSIIYKANKMEDIWFAEKNDRYSIYAMSQFKGCKEKWDEGKDAVYRYIVNGRYGCYDGEWINIQSEKLKIVDNKLIGAETRKTLV